MRNRPSASAENVATVRALLTGFGLLDDPYAERFLGPTRHTAYRCLGRLKPNGLGKRAYAWILVRTRFYDDLVAHGIDTGIRQIVIIGAGYDARAWRLASPGVRFVEIDHPVTQGRKLGLAPAGGPVFVAADLAVEPVEDVLARAGVRSDQPAVYVCEGLTLYLDESDVRQMLGHIARVSASGTVLGVDFVLPSLARGLTRVMMAVQRVILAAGGEHLLFSLRSADTPDFLRSLGWADVHLHTGRELYEQYLLSTGLPQPQDDAYLVSAVIE